jgi:hypothetical protein
MSIRLLRGSFWVGIPFDLVVEIYEQKLPTIWKLALNPTVAHGVDAHLRQQRVGFDSWMCG